MTETFNVEVENQSRDGLLDANTAVERMLQNKLATVLSLLTEERQRSVTKEVKRGPHRARRKMQSWTVMKSLSMIAPEVMNPVNHRCKREITMPKSGQIRGGLSWKTSKV